MRIRCVSWTFPLLLFLSFISGCASKGEIREDLEKTPITQAQFPDVEEARQLIIFGSPASLLKAYDLLLSSPAGKSPEGQRMTYIAENLLSLLYPRVSFDAGVSLTPVNSVYPEIFADVKKGEFSTLMEDWDSPLLLNLVSCAALFTDNREVLILCGAAAQASERNIGGGESAVPPYILGVVEKKRGELENALVQFERSYNLDDSVYTAKWEAAKILRTLDDNANAVVLLRQLSDSYPDTIQYRFELSACYLDMGLTEEALRTVESINIENENPQYDEYLLLRSKIEEAAGNIAAAVESMALLQERNPDDLSVLKRYGFLLLQDGQAEKGITVLELALERGLEDLEVKKRLFRYYAGHDEWEKGGAIADDIASEFEEPEYLAPAAEVYLQLERYEAAEKYAALLVEAEPEKAEFLTLYGRIVLERGRLGEAEGIFRTALQYSNSRQQRSSLYYYMSKTREDLKARAEMLQNALFENMENVDALLEIAYLYRGAGEVRKAYRYIKQAAVLAPDNTRVMNLYDELEGLVGQ